MSQTRNWKSVPAMLALAALAVSLWAASALALADEWTPIGPLGGRVYDFVVHPTNCLDIYVPTGGALYHTVDGGITWAAVSSCPADVWKIWRVPSSPSTLFVLTGTCRIYKSADAGDTWADLGASGYCFAFDERFPERLFVGGSGGRVLKSVDGGATWAMLSTGSLDPVVAIAISPRDSNVVYIGGMGDGDVSGFGILKTTDGGATWQDADAGLEWVDIAGIYIDPAHPDTLFASTTGCCMYWGRGLFRSTNGGGSWSEVNTGLPCVYCPSDIDIGDFAAIPGAPGSYLALTEGRAFRSDDGGITWSEEATGIDDGILSLRFWAQDPAIRLFGAANGLWRATPWTVERFGIVPIAQSGIAIHPVDPDILYTIGDIAYKSVDGGATWNLLRNGATWASGTAIAINPQNPDILFVGDYQGPSEVYRTLDGGASWDTSLGLATDDIKIDPVDPNIVYAAGNGGLFKTLDCGETWDLIHADRAASIAINPLRPSTIYIGTASYGIRKSVDGGLNWTPMNAGLPADLAGKHFLALAVDPVHPDTLYCGGVGSVGIYKSTNGGLEWLPANTGLTNMDVRKIIIDPVRPNFLYAQSAYGPVHRSIDGARSWELLNPGLETGQFAHDIALDPLRPNVLYFCCNAGLFRYESSFDPSTGADPPPIAAIDILSYPNPFSGSATVEYVLARRGKVRLAVYDVAGREVAVLVARSCEAGRHTAPLEGRGLSPGVYFIRGSIDGRAVARKCVIAK